MAFPLVPHSGTPSARQQQQYEDDTDWAFMKRYTSGDPTVLLPHAPPTSSAQPQHQRAPPAYQQQYQQQQYQYQSSPSHSSNYYGGNSTAAGMPFQYQQQSPAPSPQHQPLQQPSPVPQSYPTASPAAAPGFGLSFTSSPSLAFQSPFPSDIGSASLHDPPSLYSTLVLSPSLAASSSSSPSAHVPSSPGLPPSSPFHAARTPSSSGPSSFDMPSVLSTLQQPDAVYYREQQQQQQQRFYQQRSQQPQQQQQPQQPQQQPASFLSFHDAQPQGDYSAPHSVPKQIPASNNGGTDFQLFSAFSTSPVAPPSGFTEQQQQQHQQQPPSRGLAGLRDSSDEPIVPAPYTRKVIISPPGTNASPQPSTSAARPRQTATGSTAATTTMSLNGDAAPWQPKSSPVSSAASANPRSGAPPASQAQERVASAAIEVKSSQRSPPKSASSSLSPSEHGGAGGSGSSGGSGAGGSGSAGSQQKRKRRESSKSKAVKLTLQEFLSANAASDASASREQMSALEEDASPVLWIGNIGPQVTEDELREEFGEHGNILNLRILRDRYCAFITFEHVECAVAAKQALDSAIFGNQYIVINYRQIDKGAPLSTESTVTNPPSNSLWVGNICEGVSRQDLQREFGQYGIIESIRLLRTCAFVNYSSIDEATAALIELQGKQLGSMNLKINYGKSRIYDSPDFGGSAGGGSGGFGGGTSPISPHMLGGTTDTPGSSYGSLPPAALRPPSLPSSVGGGGGAAGGGFVPSMSPSTYARDYDGTSPHGSSGSASSFGSGSFAMPIKQQPLSSSTGSGGARQQQYHQHQHQQQQQQQQQQHFTPPYSHHRSPSGGSGMMMYPGSTPNSLSITSPRSAASAYSWSGSANYTNDVLFYNEDEASDEARIISCVLCCLTDAQVRLMPCAHALCHECASAVFKISSPNLLTKSPSSGLVHTCPSCHKLVKRFEQANALPINT